MIEVFDKYGNKLRSPEFIELQWNRNFNGFGDFSLYLPAAAYDKNIKYIQNVGRPETGIVQKYVFEQKTAGDFVTISGNFIDALLDWGSIWTGYSYTGSDADTVAWMMKAWAAGSLQLSEKITLPGFTGPDVWTSQNQLYTLDFDFTAGQPSSIDVYCEGGKTFGSAFIDWLNGSDYSARCTPIFNASTKESTEPLLGLKIATYKGTDRSNSVYFGKAWRNIESVLYSFDDSNVASDYIAVQQIDDDNVSSFTNVYKVATDDGVKNFITEEYIDSGNRPQDVGYAFPAKILTTTISQTDNETSVRSQMKEKAKLDMLNRYKEQTISADVLQNRFIYLTDYDLGDTCSIVIDEIEESFKAQIVEVHEVQKSNKLDVEIVMGTPSRTNYRRITDV